MMQTAARQAGRHRPMRERDKPRMNERYTSDNQEPAAVVKGPFYDAYFHFTNANGGGGG